MPVQAVIRPGWRPLVVAALAQEYRPEAEFPARAQPEAESGTTAVLHRIESGYRRRATRVCEFRALRRQPDRSPCTYPLRVSSVRFPISLISKADGDLSACGARVATRASSMGRPFEQSDFGFSLIEALAAITMLSVALVGLASIIALATGASGRAQVATAASVLAVEKMEQLRGLAWGFDGLGLPRSDRATDLADPSERPTGGPGLSPSPAGVLSGNVPGYCDFADVNGRSLGGGAAPPAGAIYMRRWSIEPLPADPDNTLVLQVIVLRVVDHGSVAARMVTVRTRKAS